MKIKFKDFEVEVELYDNLTSKAIVKALPINAEVDTWGEEIYFKIPVHVELDSSSQEVVSKGDLGFWPSGDCFCIFFGPTPGSKDGEIRPASAVNVFGKVKGDLSLLKNVKSGDKVRVEK